MKGEPTGQSWCPRVNYLRQLNDWWRWGFLEFRVPQERRLCLPKRCSPGGFPYNTFPCWVFVECYHSLDRSFQRNVRELVLWSHSISTVSGALLEAPQKPLLRMPDPSNSKSNHQSDLRNRLACWHISEKQLQHSLFTLRLPVRLPLWVFDLAKAPAQKNKAQCF